MAEHTLTPWKMFRGEVFAADGDVVGSIFRTEAWSDGDPVQSEDQANAAFIVKAVNNHDALVKALEQCAAPFSTRPGSVMQCAAYIHHEFQRRMDIASEALRAAVGTVKQP